MQLLELIVTIATINTYHQPFPTPHSAGGGEWAQESATTYKVTLQEGTEDATNWTISPTEAAEGSPVTATYSGEKRVKSVKAVKNTPLEKTQIKFGFLLAKSYLCSRNHINNEIMEARTTTAEHSIATAWNEAKNLSNSQKLELVSIIIDSVRKQVRQTAADDEEYSLRPFTMEELNARIDQAEAEIAAGLGTPHEEVMREMDEEIERWEQEDLKLEAI